MIPLKYAWTPGYRAWHGYHEWMAMRGVSSPDWEELSECDQEGWVIAAEEELSTPLRELGEYRATAGILAIVCAVLGFVCYALAAVLLSM